MFTEAREETAAKDLATSFANKKYRSDVAPSFLHSAHSQSPAPSDGSTESTIFRKGFSFKAKAIFKSLNRSSIKRLRNFLLLTHHLDSGLHSRFPFTKARYSGCFSK